MSGEDYLFLVAFRLVMQSPLLIVTTIGLWLALSRRRRHLRAFTWASWGFGLLLGYSVAQVIIQVTLAAVPAWIFEGGARITPETAMAMSLWSFASYPLFIGGIAVLARAVFIGREGAISKMVASAT